MHNSILLVAIALLAAMGSVIVWQLLRLRSIQGRLAAVLAAESDAIVIADEQKRIRTLNKAAELLTGWNAGAAPGHNLEEVVQFIGEGEENGCVNAQTGAVVPVRLLRTLVPGGRGAAGNVMIFRDSSELARLEESLRRMRKSEQLQRAASSVERDFHDLLTVIGGHADLLADAPGLSPALRRSAESIRHAFHEATRLNQQLDEYRVPPAAETERRRGVILLAEDDDSLRGLLANALRSAGYIVLPARDGSQALQMAACEFHRIDLVLTDLEMPAVSGTELMEYFWTLDPKLSVLFLSGHEQLAEQVTRGHDNARFLGKPFRLATLLREVAAMMAISSHPAPLENSHASARPLAGDR